MKIAVVGSINIDVSYQVDKRPKKGETVFGNSYILAYGGKGANQAVILSAIEKDVVFFGAVGDDGFGKSAKADLLKKDLDLQIINKKGNSGLAVIERIGHDNSIVVINGANAEITVDDIKNFLDKNPNIEIIVSQLEINVEAVKYLIEQAFEKGIKIILNPAPSLKIELDIIDKTTYLIPNEIEAKLIFCNAKLEDIVLKYQGKVVITMGDKGVMYFDGDSVQVFPAQKIKAIDTTGAGDSFVAGFTAGISRGFNLKKAISLGVEVSSLTCQSIGAQTAYKKIKETSYEKTRNTK